jgi:hypothetical protein
MGLPDLYPFVLSEAALKKIRFVHDTIEPFHLQNGSSRVSLP